MIAHLLTDGVNLIQRLLDRGSAGYFARQPNREENRAEAPGHENLRSYCACNSWLTFSFCSITRSKLPPRILRMSSSEYPLRISASVIFGNLEASSMPSGMLAPSKSEPRPT